MPYKDKDRYRERMRKYMRELRARQPPKTTIIISRLNPEAERHIAELLRKQGISFKVRAKNKR